MFKLVEDSGIRSDEQPDFAEMTQHRVMAEKIWRGIKPFIQLQNGIVHYVAPPLEGRSISLSHIHIIFLISGSNFSQLVNWLFEHIGEKKRKSDGLFGRPLDALRWHT